MTATIAQLADLYQREVERRASFNTSRTVRSALVRYRADFGSLIARDARPEWFVAWIDARRARGDAPKTILRDLYFAREMFDLGVELGLCDQNPVARVPRRAKPTNAVVDRSRAKFEVLEVPQIRRLLEAESIHWSRRLLWVLLLSTGARISEAAGLSYADYNPRMTPLGELVIRCQWNPSTRELAPTKTDLVRYVPVIPLLAEWLARARAEFTRRQGYAPEPEDILVPYRGYQGRAGDRRWSPRTALRCWHRDLEAVGIPHPASGPRRLHSTRHTFSTLAVRAGADWRAIATITHNPQEEDMAGCAFGQYVDMGWPYLCAAIGKLRF